MLNKVTLIGNLAKDPETRFMSNGESVTNIVLGTEGWKDKNGDTKTEWHNVTLFKKLAEVSYKYLKKGSTAYIEGRLETKKWTDKNGIEKYSTSIIASEMKMLGGRPKSDYTNTKSDQSDDIPF